MTTSTTKPRVTSFAPQFLVDDLARSIAFYRKLGFVFGEPWGGFYAIGEMDGLELHLKEAPKNDAERRHRREHEHLDAAAGVDGIEAFYERCIANGVTVLRPLAATAWGTNDFYVEDPDGYIISFGGAPPKHDRGHEVTRRLLHRQRGRARSDARKRREHTSEGQNRTSMRVIQVRGRGICATSGVPTGAWPKERVSGSIPP